MSFMIYFKEHFLLPIWCLGIFSLSILVINMYIQKSKEKKFEKIQLEKKLQQQQLLYKNKLSKKGL